MSEPTADQIAHDDELNWKRAYVNALSTASYFWQIKVDGKIVLQEYDDASCSCTPETGHDPTGHIHLKSEWPAPPFTLVAEPQTLNHQKLPGLEILIAVGETPIWERLVRQRMYKVKLTLEDGSTHDAMLPRSEDSLIVGVQHADGSENVVIVHPDGSHAELASLKDALAHDPGPVTNTDLGQPSDHPNDVKDMDKLAQRLNGDAGGDPPTT
jgi:hypothetical protein